MRTFKCTSHNCRPVRCERGLEAAWIFANRIARKEFGGGGYCRTCTINSWSQDGSYGQYQAFVGTTPKGQPNCTSGHNIWIGVANES